MSNKSTQKVKWAVIGATGIADKRTIPEGIMPAENSVLAAVVSAVQDKERLEEVAAKYGNVPWFTDVEQMLAAVEIDACYISCPPAFHPQYTRSCAEAGVHVLCEKPLGRTVEEAEGMVAVCRDKGVKFGTAFMIPYHHLAQEAMRIVQEGTLGEVVAGRVQFGLEYPPIPSAFRQIKSQHNGGVFMDVGNHATDVLERIMGSKVASVTALTANVVYEYEGVEDTCAALYRMRNGALGMVDTYFCTKGARNDVTIDGSDRTLFIRGMIGQGTGGTLTVHSEFNGENVEVQIDSDQRNMYLGEITAFAEAVLTDTEPPIPGEDGLWSQKVVAAVYESAQQGRQIDL